MSLTYFNMMAKDCEPKIVNFAELVLRSLMVALASESLVWSDIILQSVVAPSWVSASHMALVVHERLGTLVDVG